MTTRQGRPVTTAHRKERGMFPQNDEVYQVLIKESQGEIRRAFESRHLRAMSKKSCEAPARD
jgi:hypothetical protein